MKIQTNPDPWIAQGEIISEVTHIEHISEVNGTVRISQVIFPHVYVLTQACDLRQDHRNRTQVNEYGDQLLVSVLVAPLYNLEHIAEGNHLSELEQKCKGMNSKQKAKLKDNQMSRYHYFDFGRESGIVPSVIDFKHYFSVTLDYLYIHREKHFVCKVDSLYREDVSQRFAAFLSRIGLPDKQPVVESTTVATSS